MPDYHPFEQRLARQWDPASWREVTVLVAVSGGADSVALLLGLHAISQQSAGQLIVAHFNHRLRGSASDADAQFVQRLSEELGRSCTLGCADSVIAAAGDGLEAEARQQRYRFFRAVGDRYGARYVVTAHTADDQAETILHRILRGTGLAGLAGIPFARRLSEMTTVLRPMLGAPRRAVLDYLHDRHQEFCEDTSNALTVFTRNRIRHQLMPMLAEQFNPQVVSSLLRLGNLAREAQHVIDAAVDPLFETAVAHRTPDRAELALAPLSDQPPFLVRELLVRLWKLQDWPRQSMGEWRWSQLCDLVQTDAQPTGGAMPASVTLPGNIQAEIDGDVMVLRKG